MSNQVTQLEQLVPMLDMVYQAKQVQLARINAQIARLREQLESLDFKSDSELTAPATRAGADVLWNTWAQDRRKLINQEILQHAQKREALRLKVAKALSKRDAAQALLNQSRQDALRLEQRRASYSG